MATTAAGKEEAAAKKKLFNDAMRGQWEAVVETYKACHFARDVKITRWGDTALHLAVSNGDADVVRELVGAVDPGDPRRILWLKNDRGDTALHVAAALGMADVCKLMAEREPRLTVEARNKERETPLFLAALHGRESAFLVLHRMSRGRGDRRLSYCKRENRDTILHVAISGEHFKLAFQIMHLYRELINVQNNKGETALHLLANKPHAFRSGIHLELFDRIIYACIVIHPLGVNIIEEHDDDDSTQQKVGNSKFLGKHTDFIAMSKHIFTKLVGGGDKKEYEQGNTRKSSQVQMQPQDSLNLLQSEREVTTNKDSNSVLEEIITKGMDDEQEQMSFTEALHEQHEDYDIGDEDLDNSLKEIVTEGDKENEDYSKSQNLEPRRSSDSQDYLFTRAQIIENVAAWSIFIIYGLKILFVILGVVGLGIWRMHIIRERKQKHKYAFQVMEELVEQSTLWEYEVVRRPHARFAQKEDTPILIAARKGVTEIVTKILDTFPIAMQDVDTKGKNVVLLAVENREPDVYKLMLKRETMKDSVFGIVDSMGNSALHLAATLGDNHRPWAVPGAALQMQWEIKWYKFIQRSMEQDIFASFNKAGQTARDIFSEKHKELIKEGSQWLTNTSQSCSVVAALIAAVAFASISTVPGGTNQSSGVPLLERQVAFEMFAIASLVALCSSVTSLVMFLSILTSRYEEEDFEKDLPRKLILGLTFVFLSIAAMLVAFCSAHFFVVQEKLRYVAYPIYAVSCLPITLFAMAHFRLYIDLITSTITHVPQRAYKIQSM